MNNTLAIIQARTGSSRLPGKMLLKLGDDYIIYWVIKRLLKCKKIDKLIVATSSNSKDDFLAEVIERIGVSVFRGDEDDVLGRFYKVSKKYNYDNIVRVCADNPFIDPNEVDKLIDFFLCNSCDYSFNHQDKLSNNYADGFGAEIFTQKTLNYLNQFCNDIKIREHVTLYLWENIKLFRINTFKAPKELSYPKLKFDLDTKKDYEKLSELILHGVSLDTKASDIIRTYGNLQKNYE